MKKWQLMLILTLIFTSMILVGCSRAEKKAESPQPTVAAQPAAAAPAPAQVEETKAPTNLKATDLYGKWHGEQNGLTFDLNLAWDEGYFRGSHSIVKKIGSSVRFDSTNNEITITGKFTNTLPQKIYWKSMRNGQGTAEVTLIDQNTLKWKNITQQGDHYFPQEMILKR